MKGAVVDFLFPVGHKNLNENIIANLSEISDITTVTTDGYFNNQSENFNKVSFKNIKKIKQENNIFLSRLYALKNLLNTNKILRWEEYDYIFINTFETITFAIGRRFIKNKRVYIVHHNNIDELNNRVKRFFFNRYKNRVHHVVFEDFIKEYLVNVVGVHENRVHVLSHPLNYKDETEQHVNENLCVGLSNSNDPLLIEELVKCEKKENVFSKNNIKLVLKSSDEHENNEAIKVIKGYISKDEYSNYIKQCKFVLVPFKKSYKYRTSGVVIDALSNGKIVIGVNIPIIRAYVKKYPSICYTFDTVNEIPEIMLNINNLSEKKIKWEFEKFKSDHSDPLIIEELRSIIGA